MKTFKHFSGETELKGAWMELQKDVAIKFPGVKAKRVDSFSVLVGTPDGKYDRGNYMPVTRVVRFNSAGSRHVCDSRCRCAKGGNCECSCGGKFHGIDA